MMDLRILLLSEASLLPGDLRAIASFHKENRRLFIASDMTEANEIIDMYHINVLVCKKNDPAMIGRLAYSMEIALGRFSKCDSYNCFGLDKYFPDSVFFIHENFISDFSSAIGAYI